MDFGKYSSSAHLYSCSAPVASHHIILQSTQENDSWTASGWGSSGAQAGRMSSPSYPEDPSENCQEDFGYDDCPFEFDDSDESDCSSSTTDSIRDHVYEGGLRYHAYHAGKYAYPNDENEQSREEIKHTMSVMLCDGQSFLAPVEEALEHGGQVLDLGTGTGIWPMQLAEEYPDAVITGIDLSPIQPSFVPENVRFFVDDIEDEWVDPENKYDYIHMRFALHTLKDRKSLMERVIRHLKPGGYFEIQDIDASYPRCDDHTFTSDTPYAFRDYLKYFEAGLKAMGADISAIQKASQEMRAAGFEDVTEITKKLPLGLWPADKKLRLCGLFWRTAVMDGLKGLCSRPFQAIGLTPTQIEVFLVDVRKAVMDGSFHTYFPLTAVYGRKPLDP
ncbi:S-adenosyl-L-methionine-dependent methyltransferase [Pseudoneurospora amorphoporcata]|uniref:S-adenosyl-L-methionine-dependent methyltransferase n=1 Tax=Pseudoneurospora amorphoporcata TaxID=241081 RepID=A0AAN6NTQ3_9PEZI|nr:S-adenosyl-L-methionine-dependent methyltransferase [Pseudoneurospora amorphoporcata]